MHELSIAQAVVERVENLRNERHSSRVSRVVLQVGSLAGIDCTALRQALPLVVENTALRKTEWKIVPVAAKIHCSACGCESQPENCFAVCAHCESADVRIIQGRELLIETVTLIEED